MEGIEKTVESSRRRGNGGGEREIERDGRGFCRRRRLLRIIIRADEDREEEGAFDQNRSGYTASFLTGREWASGKSGKKSINFPIKRERGPLLRKNEMK